MCTKPPRPAALSAQQLPTPTLQHCASSAQPSATQQHTAERMGCTGPQQPNRRQASRVKPAQVPPTLVECGTFKQAPEMKAVVVTPPPHPSRPAQPAAACVKLLATQLSSSRVCAGNTGSSSAHPAADCPQGSTDNTTLAAALRPAAATAAATPPTSLTLTPRALHDANIATLYVSANRTAQVASSMSRLAGKRTSPPASGHCGLLPNMAPAAAGDVPQQHQHAAAVTATAEPRPQPSWLASQQQSLPQTRRSLALCPAATCQACGPLDLRRSLLLLPPGLPTGSQLGLAAVQTAVAPAVKSWGNHPRRHLARHHNLPWPWQQQLLPLLLLRQAAGLAVLLLLLLAPACCPYRSCRPDPTALGSH
ncbi:hypothetical protein COO60DRAFT_865749 [Scenedesmus sp. NREL 46B-D3]|nr:hypothetical protein COO60DRAFT_865749 [Scenedesmus sp. NREL 46B-D3]